MYIFILFLVYIISSIFHSDFVLFSDDILTSYKFFGYLIGKWMNFYWQ